MGASALSLLLALAPAVLLEESCNDWSPLSQVALNFETLGFTFQLQASKPSLYLHFASGRLAARLTPYVILLILKVGLLLI